MKNAPATFQRMINEITKNFGGCEAYIDECDRVWQYVGATPPPSEGIVLPFKTG